MNCDQDIQEEIKESMRLPWTPRPTFTTKAADHAGHRPGYDRRSTGILKRARRIWWHWSDSIGAFLWCIVAAMVGTGIVLVFGLWPRVH